MGFISFAWSWADSGLAELESPLSMIILHSLTVSLFIWGNVTRGPSSNCQFRRVFRPRCSGCALRGFYARPWMPHCDERHESEPLLPELSSNSPEDREAHTGQRPDRSHTRVLCPDSQPCTCAAPGWRLLSAPGGKTQVNNLQTRGCATSKVFLETMHILLWM